MKRYCHSQPYPLLCRCNVGGVNCSASSKIAGCSCMSEKTIEDQADLSDREMEILKLLVEGYDFRGTAEKLFISPNTVRKHIGNIYQKLHINSKAQAIRLAMKKRWI